MKIFLLVIMLLVGISAFYVFDNFGKTVTNQDEQIFSNLSYYKDGKFLSLKEITYFPDKVRNGPAGTMRFLDNSRFAPKDKIPVIKLASASFAQEPEDYLLYWLGHSSAILELDGKRIAFDPVIENAAPVWFMVKRYVSSPLDINDLPKLDYVVITHNHYDHLEKKSIKAIKDAKFIVPLGVGRALQGWGVEKERIIELGWDEEYKNHGLVIKAFRGIHYSGRSPWDRDKTLWNSYGVFARDKKIFWGGDTGYGEHFAEIAQEVGGFDFAALEIDGWNPAWPRTHLFPNEVVMAAQDLGVKSFLPIHWGVFELALHPWAESIEMVANQAQKAGIMVQSPIMGKAIVPEQTITNNWWQKLK